MKKSDVIKRLTEIIHDTRRATRAWTSVEIAELILESLETMGMKPPGYEYTMELKDGTHTFSEPGWEPEKKYNPTGGFV